MERARAMAIDGLASTGRQRNVKWQLDSNGRLVAVTDIKIKEEEIVCK